MRRFHDEATTQQAAEVVLRGRIAFLRTRMASVVEVQQQTAAAEEADAGVLRVRLGRFHRIPPLSSTDATSLVSLPQSRSLPQLESNRLLDGRLGRAIGGKGLRLGDLVNTWEATNGEVRRALPQTTRPLPSAAHSPCPLSAVHASRRLASSRLAGQREAVPSQRAHARPRCRG